MISAEELLQDTSTFAYRKVPQVPRDQLYRLALHPSAAVRAVAAKLAPANDAPCFISDSVNRVNIIVADRIKQEPSPVPAPLPALAKSAENPSSEPQPSDQT
jgi:hypothetical protein